MRKTRLDLLAVLAAGLALVMVVGYLAVIRQQSGQPALWFLAALIIGAALAGYGARTSSSHRLGVLLVAGIVLVMLGMLGILSIGLPILVAGLLCFVAAVRTGNRAARDGAGTRHQPL